MDARTSLESTAVATAAYGLPDDVWNPKSGANLCGSSERYSKCCRSSVVCSNFYSPMSSNVRRVRPPIFIELIPASSPKGGSCRPTLEFLISYLDVSTQLLYAFVRLFDVFARLFDVFVRLPVFWFVEELGERRQASFWVGSYFGSNG